MADRIYKGKLVTRFDKAFPEAARGFNEHSLGNVVPFEEVSCILRADDCDVTDKVDGTIWIASKEMGSWIKIDKDGTIEMGASGV